jgi:hypothetical protein
VRGAAAHGMTTMGDRDKKPPEPIRTEPEKRRKDFDRGDHRVKVQKPPKK